MPFHSPYVNSEPDVLLGRSTEERVGTATLPLANQRREQIAICVAVASAVLWIEEARKLVLCLLRAARRGKGRGAGMVPHAA